MVAIRDGRCLRIEVKTGSSYSTGLYFLKNATNKADHYAAIVHSAKTHSVTYLPPLPSEEAAPDKPQDSDSNADQGERPQPSAKGTGQGRRRFLLIHGPEGRFDLRVAG